MKKPINPAQTAIITLIALLLIISGGLTASALFSDINTDNEFLDAVKYVEQEKIVNGYPDGTFKTLNTINRAEFTKIIINAKYSETETKNCTPTKTFPDVRPDDWFAPFVCLAANNNIIVGYPDGTFKPQNNINFAEASKIIVATFGYETSETSTSAIWYERYVKTLENKKAIPPGINEIEKQITRGEMAELIYRLKQNITDKPSKKFFTKVARTPNPNYVNITPTSSPVTTNSGLQSKLENITEEEANTLLEIAKTYRIISKSESDKGINADYRKLIDLLPQSTQQIAYNLLYISNKNKSNLAETQFIEWGRDKLKSINWEPTTKIGFIPDTTTQNIQNIQKITKKDNRATILYKEDNQISCTSYINENNEWKFYTVTSKEAAQGMETLIEPIILKECNKTYLSQPSISKEAFTDALISISRNLDYDLYLNGYFISEDITMSNKEAFLPLKTGTNTVTIVLQEPIFDYLNEMSQKLYLSSTNFKLTIALSRDFGDPVPIYSIGTNESNKTIIKTFEFNPANYANINVPQTPEENNLKRKADIKNIANALFKYSIDHDKTYPNTITEAQKTIGSGNGQSNICNNLIPDYLDELPFDPSAPGAHYTNCSDYNTEYQIQINPTSKTLLVSANNAELSEYIAIQIQLNTP